jgi:hypothetical protein
MLLLLLCALFVLLGDIRLNAQDRGNANWFVRVKPYLWLSNLDVEETLEKGHGDHIFGDFFVPLGDTVLEESWALRFEVGKGRLRGLLNFSNANIKNPGEFKRTDNEEIKFDGAYDLTWFTTELFLSAQIGPFAKSHGFEIYAGARYMRHDEDNVIDGSGDIKQISETWVDPVVGARIYTELGRKWWAQFHTDIGGFGVGTEFTWTLGGELGFRIAKPLDITMRYDYQEIEYNNEKTGADRFVWNNGVQQGWYFGLQFKI